LCAAVQARAATVAVSVSDMGGKPAANAVVELVADAPSAASGGHVPAEAVIDQRHETFLPLVSLVRKGGAVTFTNNDTTMHQVYSFSPIKQFQFEIDRGQRSKPVVFDKPGVASIGCNIHDQMITYVYVAESPYAAMTDAAGDVSFENVPAGAYRAQVWHPMLTPGKPVPQQAITVAKDNASLSFALPITSSAPMKRMHMGSY
jgi:plastocyanin